MTETEEHQDLAERQKKFLQMEDGYQEGAILYSSWGYDQTNVDFYKIVKRTAKSVVLRPILSELLGAPGYGAMSGYSVPVDEFKDPKTGYDVAWRNGDHHLQDPTFRRKLKFDAAGKPQGCSVVYGWGSLWDGQRKYTSWYA